MNSQNLVRLSKVFVATALVSLTAGCSWLTSLEVDPTREWTPNRLYSEARDAMNDKNWTVAKDYYTKLEARYPFGAYAQQAQIDLAYVYFKDDEAAVAVESLDRFLRAYPNHPNSDYALYLKGLATLNERDGLIASMTRQNLAYRDAQSTRDAFDIFKELAGRFPESRYAVEARRRMHELVLAQARHQYMTAEYYYERKAYLAAINRAKTVLTDFQTSPVCDDAMALMANCYHELGMLDLEKDMRRVIELNQNRSKNIHN